jgi:hypothetical protein
MIHFKAFGVIFLHNMVDKTYRGGHFRKKISSVSPLHHLQRIFGVLNA